MPTPLSDRIIDYLKQPDYEPMRARKLVRAMGIADAHFGDFHDAVNALRHSGRVVLGSNNAISLPQKSGLVAGTYRGNPRGFGFVVPDEDTAHGDLYIPEGESKDAVTGDRVLCRVFRRGHRGGKQAFGGQVVEVVERGNSQFVGRLNCEDNTWYVEADGNALHGPVLIGDPGAKSAKVGDQVVIELTQYPREGKPARGVIVERLGKAGEPGVDLVSICRQFHLPDEFPEAVVEETRDLVRKFDPEALAKKREEVDRMVITIDPDDARDFDDAISLEKLGYDDVRKSKPQSKKTGGKTTKGGPAAWELGVHIADVSHFVRPGTALDDEALARGTSVYLPGKVIPMLPEALSNGLCSLQEGEPRLCKSAFIQYDAGGHVVGARFANTVIRSNKRLTYGQATDILDGKTKGFSKDVVALVKRMDELARVIQKRRLSQGMIVLELPDVHLILDNDGRVVGAEPEDTSFSHTIIEMLMVEANEAAARLLYDLGAAYLRRTHPAPDEESLDAMARFIRATGMKLPKEIHAHDMQKLLAKLRGDPESYAINMAVLRSMQMAEYSPKPIGHFALASENYSHFTSPIRRYPDLHIHRLIDSYLDGSLKKSKSKGKKPAPAPDALVELGKRMSYLSRRAESAERDLKKVKVLTLLQSQIGEEFDGIVTGVTNFGMFVQHPMYLVDGLLRIEDLGDDWWEVDTKTARIVGERSGESYRLGSQIKVRIDRVIIAERQLVLVPAATSGSKPKKGRVSKKQQSKSSGPPQRRGGKGPKSKSKRSRGKRKR